MKKMWKTHKKCLLFISTICLCIIVLIGFQTLHRSDVKEISLEFNKDIVVEVGVELNEKILVMSSDAEKIEIISGDTNEVGKVKVVIRAIKDNYSKEFETTITVNEKEKVSIEDSVDDKEITNDDNKELPPLKNDQKNDVVENPSQNEKSGTSKPTNDKKPVNDQKPNDNGNQSKPQEPIIPEEPQLPESQFASEIFKLINEYRTSKGLPAYTSNSIIQSVANQRADDMAVMGYASHNRPDGSAADYFWISATYGIAPGGENVFGGSIGFTPKAVVNSWIASLGHEQVLIADYNKYMAIGVRYSGGQVFVSANFQQY